MNDVVDALKARWRHPILGYFVLASAAANWRSLFYVIAAHTDVTDRIAYFDANTSAWTLIGLPLLTSVVIGVATPWLTYGLQLSSAKPMEWKDSLQAQAEHKSLMERKRLEDARSTVLAAAENAIIERAERDKKVDTIEDEALRARVKAELDALRAKVASGGEQTSAMERHKQLMGIAATYRERATAAPSGSTDEQRFYERAEDLEEQAHKIIVESLRQLDYSREE